MTRKDCENCGNKTTGVEIASQFAGKTLCLTCWDFVYEMNWKELEKLKQEKE